MPGILDFPSQGDGLSRILVFLRNENHRVMDLQVRSESEISSSYDPASIKLEPMSALKFISLGDGLSTSFYYESKGLRQGYVKGSVKPWEMLLMSWWALDLYVGVDKELGDASQTGTIFYTSLKPWNRTKSDMWKFADFLSFWGWNL